MLSARCPNCSGVARDDDRVQTVPGSCVDVLSTVQRTALRDLVHPRPSSPLLTPQPSDSPLPPSHPPPLPRSSASPSPSPSANPSFSPAQLYELVSDVPAYANFIPFCTSSTVLDAQGYPTTWKPGPEPFQVHAELAVGFGGLEERYVSKVTGTPFERVSVSPRARRGQTWSTVG